MLNRLWSPSNLLLQPIQFHPGVNLILGEYHDQGEEENLNGIGKSSVVRLVDYMLLSDTAEKLFSATKYDFLREGDHELRLSLEVDGKSLILARRFSEASKVTIQYSAQPEVAYGVADAKVMLGNLFFPTSEKRSLPGQRFRSLMPFFIKDDIRGSHRDDPTQFTGTQSNAQEVAVLNLFLMGLPTKELIILGDRQADLAEKRREKKVLMTRLQESTGRSLGELRSEVASQNKELASLEAGLRDFNLLDDFSKVSSVLADLESDIAEARRVIGRLDRQLAKIRSFTFATKEVDAEDVAEQYRLLSSALGLAVRKTLTDVLSFRQSLADERLRFHGTQLRELESSRESSSKALGVLEGRRASLMRVYDQSNTSTSLLEAFERFAKKKIEVERISAGVADIAVVERVVQDLQLDVANAVHVAIRSIEQGESSVEDLRALFLEVVSEALGLTQSEREGAYLDVGTRDVGTRKAVPVEIHVEVPREDALGGKRLSLVAFDLTVFLHAIDAGLRLPRFLVHDGAFHAISRRSTVRALNYIYRRTKGEMFQYIATFNIDELSLTPEEEARDGHFEFDLEKVTVLRLDDDQRRLFRKRF